MTPTMTILLVVTLLALLSALAVIALRDYRQWRHRKSRERARYIGRGSPTPERSRDTTVVRST